MQMVFQDPFASLNPRKRVVQIIGQPLRLHGTPRDKVEDRVRELLGLVARARAHQPLPARVLGRPAAAHRRGARTGARAAADRAGRAGVRARCLRRAQIINLLDDLQDEFRLTYLFVAHDLSVVRHVSDRIAVMYLGKLMELSPSEDLYTKPIHPYTFALLSAIPIPDPEENHSPRAHRGGRRATQPDRPTERLRPPRCPRATDVCREIEPPLARYPNGHLAACHHPMNVSAEEIKAAVKDPASPLSAGDELPRPQRRVARLTSG